MKSKMHVSSDLSLPIEVATQAVGIFGIRGAGKTNTAGVMAEELLTANVPVAIIDPTDAWWGLRSSRDGQSEGFPVFIFGGGHGDYPLEEHDGKVIAEFIVTEQVPVVLSLRHLRKGAQRRFVTELCEELYHLKGKVENRSPLTVFIDEAPSFVPQKVMGDVARTVGAVEDLVARGRNVGFGVVLIAQRPATLNADVRSLCDTIITHRVTGKLDRTAFRGWIEENATVEEIDAVLKSLATLQNGEAWVWSPVLGVMRRVQMRMRESYDSSRTPKLGEHVRPPKKLAEIDKEKLRGKLAASVERAKQSDPAEMRKRIQVLERQIAKGQGTPSELQKGIIDDARARAKEAEAEVQRLTATVRELRGRLKRAYAHAVAIEQESALDNEPKAAPAPSHAKTFFLNEQHETHTSKRAPKEAPPRRTAAPVAPVDGDFTPNSAQQRVLNALAFYRTVGVDAPGIKHVGFIAKIKASGGHFQNTVGPLSSRGLIERTDGRISLTAAGEPYAVAPDTPPTLRDYHAAIRDMLRTGAQQRVFDAIAERGSEAATVEEIGKAANIDPTGGHFQNSIGPLVTLGVVTRSKGMVQPTDVMFPPELS